jgi:hypothetical protein
MPKTGTSMANGVTLATACRDRRVFQIPYPTREERYAV